MVRRLRLGNIVVDVVFKDIKNVHLSVYPPTGRVRISAPARMKLDTIRVFAVSKIGWIKQQQKRILKQERETKREYLERESHYVWGKRYLLAVVENDAAPAVELKHSRLILRTRAGTSVKAKDAILASWYREQVRISAGELIAKWEPIMGVKVERVFVQKMKTKWGGCNPISRSIRLNTELAKKPTPCLEYIVVHELTHLLVRNHGERFRELMEKFMPQWRQHRDELNRAPLAHETWEY